MRTGVNSKAAGERVWSGALGRRGAPAVALLPLRLFIGLTFIDAGAGKLLSPAYFGSGPLSFEALARGFSHNTPLGGVVRTLVLPHPLPVGTLMAAAELTVGMLTVIGLATRPAAAGGLALSFSFFLTASWHTHPYFYGADLPYALGWLVLLIAGPAGLPGVDRWLAQRERAVAGLADDTPVLVSLDRLEQVCAEADARHTCASAAGRACAGVHCPLLGRPAPPAADASRRALLQGTVLAGLVFGVTAVSGSAAAVWSRLVDGAGSGGATAQLGGASAPTTTSPEGTRTTQPGGAPSTSPPAGTAIGRISQIPVGQAATFTIPDSGNPGIAVRLTASDLVAFDAICTHAGCTVGYDPSVRLLVCPCHGAEYNPARGAEVVAGPAPAPLQPVHLQVRRDGTIYVV